MNHLLKYLLPIGLLAIISGCQCTPFTARYGNVIDDLSDSKLEMERFYQPGLDVSRVGMPDWRRYRWNHLLCKCKCRLCRSGCHPVEYPAYYTLRYHAGQAKKMGLSDGLPQQDFGVEQFEKMILPLPEPATQTDNKSQSPLKAAPPGVPQQ